MGKLGYPDLAEAALRTGQCDMVMLGRPLLADPQWPNKAYAGRVDEILPCIGCQEGCLNEFVEGGHPQCAVNPRTAFEHIYPDTLPRAEKPRFIGVIGAGPAGVDVYKRQPRRTYSTRLSAAGVSQEDIIALMGHTDFDVDIKHYINQEMDTLIKRCV